jgi:hypothetical protein
LIEPIELHSIHPSLIIYRDFIHIAIHFNFLISHGGYQWK